MKRRRATYLIFGVGVLLAACAHTPREPALDHSSELDLAGLAARFSTPSCEVSVPLTQAQALALAESEGVPHPETRPDWLALVAAVQPGDQLREVSCLTGNDGRLAGAVFYGLFRGGKLLGLYALHSNYWPQMNDQALARWIAQQAAFKALLPGGIYGLLSAAAFSAGAGLTIRSSRTRFVTPNRA